MVFMKKGVKNLKLGNITKVLSSFILIPIMSLSFSSCKKHNLNEYKDYSVTGYSDVYYPHDFKIFKDNFVIFNIGDYDASGIILENQKMKYCNKNNIPFGLIVNCDSFKVSEVYNDVELVKGIVSKYDVNMPVYLDIDEIVKSKDLSNDEKKKIIEIFNDKCSANGICSFLYGTDTNLCYVKDYLNYNCADSYLVMDNDTIKYSGKCSIIEENGNIKATSDLVCLVDNLGYNDKSKLISDGIYKVKSSDTILDIAAKYDISVNDLLDYNDLKERNVKEGVVLKIPSMLGRKINNDSLSPQRLDKALIGCDMSWAQVNVNWDKVSNNFDFVILRATIGQRIDDNFSKYANECNKRNINLGAYCFNDLTYVKSGSGFEKAFTNQVNFFLKQLENKNITYPVYLDIENDSYNNIKFNYTDTEIKKMLDIWKEKTISLGYTPGIYSSKSIYNNYIKKYDDDLSLWIAGDTSVNDYQEKVDFEDLKIPSDSSVIYNGKNICDADMLQISSAVANAGASNNSNCLDVNITYYDYSNLLSDDNLEIKKFDRNNYSFGIIMTVGMTGAVLGIGHKVKEKRKIKKIDNAIRE